MSLDLSPFCAVTSQVPSNIFVCVGFRVRTEFKVSGTSESLLSVYEPQDKGEGHSVHCAPGNTQNLKNDFYTCAVFALSQNINVNMHREFLDLVARFKS